MSENCVRGVFALVLLCTSIVPVCNAESIHLEAVIDGTSELVIQPGGLSWHHLSFAKPGNYGTGPLPYNPNTSYDTVGPTYIDGHPWTPQWGLAAPRVEDVSNVFFPLPNGGLLGYSLSPQYAHEFDTYPQYAPDFGVTGQGEWVTLGSVFQLNRGTISLSSYNGHPSILFSDPAAGQDVYSVDIAVAAVPLPSAAWGGLLLTGLLAVRHIVQRGWASQFRCR